MMRERRGRRRMNPPRQRGQRHPFHIPYLLLGEGVPSQFSHVPQEGAGGPGGAGGSGGGRARMERRIAVKLHRYVHRRYRRELDGPPRQGRPRPAAPIVAHAAEESIEQGQGRHGHLPGDVRFVRHLERPCAYAQSKGGVVFFGGGRGGGGTPAVAVVRRTPFDLSLERTIEIIFVPLPIEHPPNDVHVDVGVEHVIEFFFLMMRRASAAAAAEAERIHMYNLSYLFVFYICICVCVLVVVLDSERRGSILDGL
mmetsp:Transcript_6709/g.19844  ORF Transcript_6709/g.19844 Transcript_6709/m.19844 type:complete len:254 (-) Transcript_6709:297-1058(-)